MIKVGIIGGAGYTAGELIRLLINHPEAETDDFIFIGRPHLWHIVRSHNAYLRAGGLIGLFLNYWI